MRPFVFFLLLWLTTLTGNLQISAQTPVSDSTAKGRTGNPPGHTVLYSNDSIAYHVILPELEIPTLRVFSRKKDQRRYDRLVAAVRKTYPLAKAAAERMITYAEVLESGTRKDRKALVREFEREIKEEHGDRLKRMSLTDGRVLLRLLDRETRHTSYDLVAELKGSFQAIFWQGVASFFDYDLKTPFDPENVEEDKYIDEICRMIDAGL